MNAMAQTRPSLPFDRDPASVGNRQRLRIVHCFRSPVGGIFRHVRDLIDAQLAAGHDLGILCDNETGGAFEEGFFAELAPRLALGLHRMPMKRSVGPSDVLALMRAFGALRATRPDVLHSHGAKGGAYARIIGSLLRRSNPALARLYCPHGGSVHYDAATPGGRAYFALERLLERATDRLIFVSAYERDAYRAKVGEPNCPTSLVRNGLAPGEFEPVEMVRGAADFLYIGMMRDLKGTDLFLRAVASLPEATAVAVGDGPDRARYEALIDELDVDGRLTIRDPMPARDAFALARTVVVPSRAESMPYIVLEAAAAQKRLIATDVGGIPEIMAGHERTLVRPDDLQALAAAMRAELAGTREAPDPAHLAAQVRARFSCEAMAASVAEAYRGALGRPSAPGGLRLHESIS